MNHLTRILEDMTNAIERLGMRWKEKSLTIVAGPFTEYKPGDVVEIVSNSGRRLGLACGGGHGGTGHVVGQSWLLGGQHVAQIQSPGKPTPCLAHEVCSMLLFTYPSFCLSAWRIEKCLLRFDVLHSSASWMLMNGPSLSQSFQGLRIWELG